MLQQLLQTAEIDKDTFAKTLGIGREVFSEMVAGQRPIPESLLPMLSAVLGINQDYLSQARPAHPDEMTPAIWFKLRGPRLRADDRAHVLTIRRLAFFHQELEEITEKRASRWKTTFEAIRKEVDPQASPREQGRLAARQFLLDTGLDQGANGIGSVFRGALRVLGVLILETAVKDSELEGCSFYVGAVGRERPCIFANGYKSTWFRRNHVLLHELAHAIFDVESVIASLDFTDTEENDVLEQRADSFAQECLAPKEVLWHLIQKYGMKRDDLTGKDLAQLVACTDAEQRLVVRALYDSGLIGAEKAAQLESENIADILPTLTERALGTSDYVKKVGVDHAPWLAKRQTTTSPIQLTLPSKYVENVSDAYLRGLISRGKTAKMLMVDEGEVDARFPLELSAEV